MVIDHRRGFILTPKFTYPIFISYQHAVTGLQEYQHPALVRGGLLADVSNRSFKVRYLGYICSSLQHNYLPRKWASAKL